MSAVPKRKLCWNCDGNIAKDVDNCPYCGVYLNSPEAEEDTSWNPMYTLPSQKPEDVLSPLYQIQPEIEEENEEIIEKRAEREKIKPEYTFDSKWLHWRPLLKQFKQDIFPLLFLMMGSIFFLFGVVLLLFSQNGTLVLQWREKDGFYFLLFALPLVGFGWKFLQQLPSDD